MILNIGMGTHLSNFFLINYYFWTNFYKSIIPNKLNIDHA